MGEGFDLYTNRVRRYYYFFNCARTLEENILGTQTCGPQKRKKMSKVSNFVYAHTCVFRDLLVLLHADYIYL